MAREDGAARCSMPAAWARPLACSPRCPLAPGSAAPHMPAPGRPAPDRGTHCRSGDPAGRGCQHRVPASRRALASRLSRDIRAALRKRTCTVALTVDDPENGVACGLRQSLRFDSASVVKVTILGALLRRAMEQHRYLTSTEVNLTTAMITRSDNHAASTLWARLGPGGLQHFLNLAGMTATALGPGGNWGLTQVTAHDEMTLLGLLTSQQLGAQQRLRRLRPRPDVSRHNVAAVGSSGGHARRCHGAREERLARGPDGRLAYSQHRQFLRGRDRDRTT